MTYVNKGSMTAIGVIFPVLALTLFVTRFSRFLRHDKGYQFGPDDFFIVPAMSLTVAVGVGTVIGAQMNIIGSHTLPSITPTQYERLGKFEYPFWICHVLAIGSIKLSILFLYRRLFRGRSYSTVFDWTNWTLICLVALWTAVFLFLDIFACGIHMSLSWSSVADLRGDCIDTFAMLAGCAVFSWVMDLAILVEPLFMIGSLNMSRRRKLQASLVFLLSSFAVIAGLLRMIAWIQIEIQGNVHPTTTVVGVVEQSADVTGVVSILIFWTYMEIGVGFIVACLPSCVSHFDSAYRHCASLLSSLGSVRSVHASSSEPAHSSDEEQK